MRSDSNWCALLFRMPADIHSWIFTWNRRFNILTCIFSSFYSSSASVPLDSHFFPGLSVSPDFSSHPFLLKKKSLITSNIPLLIIENPHCPSLTFLSKTPKMDDSILAHTSSLTCYKNSYKRAHWYLIYLFYLSLKMIYLFYFKSKVTERQI